MQFTLYVVTGSNWLPGPLQVRNGKLQALTATFYTFVYCNADSLIIWCLCSTSTHSTNIVELRNRTTHYVFNLETSLVFAYMHSSKVK